MPSTSERIERVAIWVTVEHANVLVNVSGMVATRFVEEL
jgi:hypothetical protein